MKTNKKLTGLFLMLLSVFSASCTDDSDEISGDKILSEVTESEAKSLCEETVAQLDSVVPTYVAISCYELAIETSEDDDSVDCNMMAMDCIDAPPTEIVEEFESDEAECDGPNLTDSVSDCDETTVSSIRTCNEDIISALVDIADGMTCENFVSKLLGFSDPESCVALDQECPSFRGEDEQE